MSPGTLAGPTLVPLFATGFLLGWSVAWPPGPVNAEIIRRGLSRGFWPAYGLCLGGCTGDAVWALLVAGGTGIALGSAAAGQALRAVSLALLVFLAAHYLAGAWRRYGEWRRGQMVAERSRFDSAQGGFLLGLTITLTSPWSIAFWLAVMGRQEIAGRGLPAALVVTAAVLVGAATWGLALCSAVVFLRARFDSPAWDILTRVATGLLMLVFALLSFRR